MVRGFFWLIVLACALPLAAQEGELDACVVMVTVVWPDHDLSTAQVRVFRDERRQDLVEAFPAMDDSGRIVVAVPPGTYYVTALVDLNKNDKLDAGDGLGFHGVVDPSADRPQPLEVKDKLSSLRLVIALQMQADGKLAPTGVTLPPPEAATPITWCQVSGTVSGGTGKRQVVLLVPKSPRRPCHVSLPDAAGSFGLTVAAGEYYVFALEDTTENEGAGPGDLFAVHGYMAEMAREFPVVKIEQDLAEVKLDLQWRVSETGLLKSLDGTTEGPQVALETLPAVLLGTVANMPPGPVVVVSASADARFRGQAGSASTTDGRFVMALAQGVYYLNATSVQDPEGRTRRPGDLLGFHGVSDLRKAHGPQPVALRSGEIRAVEMALIAKLDEQLRPTPIE
jgi:hypothetical protein